MIGVWAWLTLVVTGLNTDMVTIRPTLQLYLAKLTPRSTISTTVLVSDPGVSVELPLVSPYRGLVALDERLAVARAIGTDPHAIVSEIERMTKRPRKR